MHEILKILTSRSVENYVAENERQKRSGVVIVCRVLCSISHINTKMRCCELVFALLFDLKLIGSKTKPSM